MNQPPQPGPARKPMSTVAIVLIVVGAVVGVVVVGFGIMAALAIFGTRRYLEEAKVAEAKNSVGAFGRGLVQCMDMEQMPSELKEGEPAAAGRRTELPATSAKVPPSLSAVSGKKYMSSATDWSDDAFHCARFSMTMPQYFQYQWDRTSPTNGTVRAVGDLDGDGKADVVVELPITCSTSGCAVGQVKETKP